MAEESSSGFNWGGLAGGLLSLGGGIASGYMANQGIDSANKANLKAIKLQNRYAVTNYKNRHTWEVQDLRRAGLNPILSAGGQPPTASAYAATVMPKGDYGIGEGVGKIVKSISDIKENKILDSSIEKAKAEAETAKANSAVAKVDAAKATNEWINLYGPDMNKKVVPWLEKFGITPQSMAAKATLDVVNKNTPEKVVEKWNQTPAAAREDWHQSNSAVRTEKQSKSLQNMSESDVRKTAEDVLKKLKLN